MNGTVKKIAITGGAGQIAYSLLFRIAHGDLFGSRQKVALHLLEVPESLGFLKGVMMELDDCAFPLLQEVKIGSDPHEMFEGVDLAILIGSKPRGPGMERKDLLQENGKIFIEQGKALNKIYKDGKVFVVGNPCNTNCLIAMHYAQELSKHQFFAMTRLDENRAKSQLAQKARVSVEDVKRVTIWGNHSSTQVPDFMHARIKGESAESVISDIKWLKEDFIIKVQKRGAEVINARGKSSAASAANGIIDSIRSLYATTPLDDWHSVAIASDGNPYGIKPGLIFSFPCKTLVNGQIEIVKNLQIDDWLKEKIAITERELLEERQMVEHLLK